jgi:hypothetical protein
MSRSPLKLQLCCVVGLAAFAADAGLVRVAAAGQPVAIIEAIQANGTSLQFMDFVELGQIIELGATGTLVLGYFRSCWQEEISGGTIRIGEDESVVENGQVKRTRVECDGGRLMNGADDNADGVYILGRASVTLGAIEQPESRGLAVAGVPTTEPSPQAADTSASAGEAPATIVEPRAQAGTSFTQTAAVTAAIQRLVTAARAARREVAEKTGQHEPDSLSIVMPGEPWLRVFSRQPIIRVDPASFPPIVLMRLDVEEPVVALMNDHRYVDLATEGVILAPGGLYRIESDKLALTFRVDPAARMAASGHLGGLLILRGR